ncbi:MAG: hypothetical protein ACFFD2_15785 [Promethearchaeota archaeon]
MVLSLLNIGGVGGKLINFAGKAQSTVKSFFGGIHKTFIKGKKGIKKGIEFFNKVSDAVKGPLNGFFALIEAFGLLDPLLKVFAGIIKMFSASALITLMPLFIEFLDIVSDPAYQAYVRALGYAFARTLELGIKPMLAIFQLWREFGWLKEWALFWRGWGNAMIPISTGLGNAVTIFWHSLRDFYNWIKGKDWNFATGVGPSGGGGSSGKKGGGGSWVSQVASAIGYQHGTDYVPMTRNYKLHEGEKVTSAAENYTASSQINRMIDLQEEANNLQRKIYNYMVYGT